MWLATDVPKFALRLKELDHDPKAQQEFIEEARVKVKQVEQDSLKYEEFLTKLGIDRTRELDDARKRRGDA